MLIFDTNAIIRYILQDNQEMADIVEQQLSANLCLIPVEVVAETVYVLTKVYSIDRQLIAETIKDFIAITNIRIMAEKAVIYALNVFAATKLDFVDCLLVGYNKTENNQIFTFDKELKKYLIKN